MGGCSMRAVAELVFVCVACAGACHTGSDPEGPPPAPSAVATLPAATAQPQQRTEHFLAGLEAAARVYADHAGRCAELSAVIDRESQAWAVPPPSSSEQRAIEADAARRERMERAMTSIVDVTMACASDPAFQRADAARRARLEALQR